MTRRAHAISRWALTLFMVGAGANHFLSPAPYVAMVPAMLPAPWALVYVSGVAEFPANLNMAVNHLPLGTQPLPSWALWGRLPLQLVLIWWASSFTRRADR